MKIDTTKQDLTTKMLEHLNGIKEENRKLAIERGLRKKQNPKKAKKLRKKLARMSKKEVSK